MQEGQEVLETMTPVQQQSEWGNRAITSTRPLLSQHATGSSGKEEHFLSPRWVQSKM